MSYEKLKTLESDAVHLERRRAATDQCTKSIADKRKGEKSLSEILERLFYRRIKAERLDEGEEELLSILDGMKHDVLRLVEMRLAARSRDLRVRAAQKRAVIHASVLPIELEEGE